MNEINQTGQPKTKMSLKRFLFNEAKITNTKIFIFKNLQ